MGGADTGCSDGDGICCTRCFGPPAWHAGLPGCASGGNTFFNTELTEKCVHFALCKMLSGFAVKVAGKRPARY